MKISISGVRGVFGQDLTLIEVDRFARLFGGSLNTGKCVLARDTRPSGRIIAQSVAAGLLSQGVEVCDLGVAPTPAAFREASKYGAGIIVTASHNPLEWNGLKFIRQGRGIFEDELESLLAAEPVYGARFGAEHNITTTYTDDIANLTRSDATVKVGLDPGGGAACGHAEKLFKNLGHRYVSINAVPGISSRGPDPTSDPLSDLRSLVIANSLDYGFALDLDADRLVVVNSMGDKLSPDATLLLCIARSIEMGVRNFVVSIDTSIAIEKYIGDRHGIVHHSKVGEANVVRKMLEENAGAGGEGSSAGFIMPQFNMCRDGLLAAATIATLNDKIVKESLSFSSAYTQIRSKVAADSSQHMRIIEKVEGMLRSEASSIMTGDGVKAIIDEDSWILIRPSNTEHAIRISVESISGNAEQLYNSASEKVKSVYAKLK